MKNLTIKLFFFITLFLTVLSSCKEITTSTLPLGKEKMIAILMDIHKVEAILQNSKSEERDSLASQHYFQVFEIHDISKEEFEKNHKLLFSQPGLADEIYDEITKRLDKVSKKK